MGKITVQVLAVGQGSCNLVQYRDDEKELFCLGMIDCGSENDKDKYKDGTIKYIRNLMVKRAQTVGETEYELKYYMDFLIVTHQDGDHLNWIREMFNDMESPKLCNDWNPGRFYRTKNDHVTITYKNVECALESMNRCFKLEHFEPGKKLHFVKCIENGEIVFANSAESYMTFDYNSSIQYDSNDDPFVKLGGKYSICDHNIILYESTVRDNEFSFQITLPYKDIYIYLSTFEQSACYGGYLTIRKKSISFDKKIQKLYLENYVNFMLDEITAYTNAEIDYEYKDYILENISTIKTVVNAQLCKDSKVLSYKSAEEIECEFSKKKNGSGIGLIKLLSFGGSYDPDKGRLQNDTATEAYKSIWGLAQIKVRPYGIDGMYKYEFAKLMLKLFPYTEQCGNDGEKYKNHSSIISSVDYHSDNLNVAMFTGDATIVSMNDFNRSGYNSEFTNPLLMTAPHHGSIKTAADPSDKSDTSVMDKFLTLVKPERIVVSHGYNNKHGHPSQTTMIRYNEICASTGISAVEHCCYSNSCDTSGNLYQFIKLRSMVYTTISTKDEPIKNGYAHAQYINHGLDLYDDGMLKFKSYANFEEDPLLKIPSIKVVDINTIKSSSPRTPLYSAKYSTHEKVQTFLPPFIREI